jgi:hypothetical protein
VSRNNRIERGLAAESTVRKRRRLARCLADVHAYDVGVAAREVGMTSGGVPPGMAGRFEQPSGERGDKPGGPNQRFLAGKNRPGLIARLKARLRRR